MKQNIIKQTNLRKEPEKGTQLDGITGEATIITQETEPADNSFK